MYHFICVKERFGISNPRNFKCPQHVRITIFYIMICFFSLGDSYNILLLHLQIVFARFPVDFLVIFYIWFWCNFYFMYGASCCQQACFICRQRLQWRCVRCTVASHDKCAPWPDRVIHLKDQPGRAVCWRHPAKWLLDKQVNFFFP